jgi:hypothetical protein
LKEILAETTAEGRGEYVLPETAALYLKRTDLVTDRVQAHFKKCGIKVWKPGTGPDAKPEKEGESQERKRAVIEVGFHSLRHSFVSLCRASNAPLAVVESIVGHSNPAMTRHYTHVGELAASAAVAGLPAVIGDAKPERKKPQPEAIVRKALAIAKSITAKNWQHKKAALLRVLVTVRDGQTTKLTTN